MRQDPFAAGIFVIPFQCVVHALAFVHLLQLIKLLSYGIIKLQQDNEQAIEQF